MCAIGHTELGKPNRVLDMYDLALPAPQSGEVPVSVPLRKPVSAPRNWQGGRPALRAVRPIAFSKPVSPPATKQVRSIGEKGTVAGCGAADAIAPTVPPCPLMFNAVTLHLSRICLLPKTLLVAAIGRLREKQVQASLDKPANPIFDLCRAAVPRNTLEAARHSGGVLVRCH